MTITLYGACAALAMLAALLPAGLWCRLQKVSYGVWIRLCVLALPLSWLCSRAVFCLSNIPYYFTTLENPALMFHFWDGGASLMGALGGLVLSAFIVARWQKAPLGTLLDAVGVGAPLGLLVARLSEGLTGGMGLGRTIVTEWMIPLGVTEDLVHPVYLYEAAVAVMILIALGVWLGAGRGRVKHPGDVLLVFLTLFGSPQVVLESLRDDSHMILIHFVRVNQILAIVLPVIALTVWTVRWAKKCAKKSQIILVWLVTAAAIAVGIVQEFAVDSSMTLLADYAVMLGATLVIALTALFVRAKAE